MKILFLCTGNSCRSILAEAIFNHLAPQGWQAMSAGSHPTGFVHPTALATLKKHQINIDGFHSKSWNSLPQQPDIVITVCSSAAGESCPTYLSPAIRCHWGLYDPAKATGSEEDIAAIFEETYSRLHQAISAFIAQLPADISKHPEQLRKLLDDIAQQFFNQ